MAKKLRYVGSSDYLKYRQSMLDLHLRGYGKVSPELYDSLYMGNPQGKPLLGLSFDGEKLVGQENYIRQDIASGGKVYAGALGINTLVDPRYRLFYGVFRKLCELTINEMKKRTDILSAFAVEDSKKYYLKYFDWKVSARVSVYKKATKYSGLNRESILSFARPGKLHKDFTLKQVAQFEPDVLDPLIKAHLRDTRYSYVYKTTQFLNWKYFNNKHYEVTGYYILLKDRIYGYCITYNEAAEKKIVDFLIDRDDRRVLNKMISALSHISTKEGAKRLVIDATPNCWYEPALKKHFFVKRWDFDFVTRTFSETIPQKDWIVQIGDFDIF